MGALARVRAKSGQNKVAQIRHFLEIYPHIIYNIIALGGF